MSVGTRSQVRNGPCFGLELFRGICITVLTDITLSIVNTTKPKRGDDNNRAALALKALQDAAPVYMSQQAIADAAGMALGTVNSMFSNRSVIGVGDFLALARAMGYSNIDAGNALIKVLSD